MNIQMVPTKSLSKHDNNCVLSSDWVLSILNPPQSEFVYTEPCASDEDKVTSEYHLRIPGKSASDTVCSFTVLSSILSLCSDRFSEKRISANLGVAKIQWRSTRIMIFQNGRIVIREAPSKRVVKSTIIFLSKLISPSIICTRCGRALVDCAMLSCECDSQQCRSERRGDASWAKAIVETKALTTILDAIQDSLQKKTDLTASDSLETLTEECSMSSKVFMDRIIESNTQGELASSIFALGYVWDLMLILQLYTQALNQSSSNSKPSSVLLRLSNLWLSALSSIQVIEGSGIRNFSSNLWNELRNKNPSFVDEIREERSLDGLIDTLNKRWSR